RQRRAPPRGVPSLHRRHKIAPQTSPHADTLNRTGNAANALSTVESTTGRGTSGERFAAVDAQRHAGQKRVGHGEQRGGRDVVDGADAAGRVVGAQGGGVILLGLFAGRGPAGG